MKKTTKGKKKTEKVKKGKIFDYETEVVEAKETSKVSNKRATRKITKKKNKKEDNKEVKETKQKIKKIKQRKNKEKSEKQKELKKQEKLEKKEQKKNEKKILSAKKIKQMKKIKETVKVVFIVSILCFALLLFILSPVFNIKEINVLNNEQVSKESVTGVLNIKNNTNIFKENNKNIKEKLKENPYIDTEKTTIRRILPSTLIINIAERKIEFLLEFGSAFAYLDKDGNILDISSTPLDGKIIIKGYNTSEDKIKKGNKLSDEDINKVKEAFQILKVARNYEFGEKITSVDIKDSDDYLLYIESEGKTVHVGDTSSLDTKMLYIKAIMEKENENEGEIFVNIDLNNKNAYFKQNV